MLKYVATTAVLLLGTSLMSCTMANEEDENTQKAQALLRATLGAGVEIKTESVETVTWPTGALGCPKPGMNYTQALVEGYRIILVANGRKFSYHGRKGGDPFYCANPESPSGWIMDR